MDQLWPYEFPVEWLMIGVKGAEINRKFELCLIHSSPRFSLSIGRRNSSVTGKNARQIASKRFAFLFIGVQFPF